MYEFEPLQIEAFFRTYCKLSIWEYQPKSKLPKDVKEYEDALVKRIKDRIVAITTPIGDSFLPHAHTSIGRPLRGMSTSFERLFDYGYLRDERKKLEGALELILRELSEGKKPDLEKLIKDSYEQLRSQSK